MYEKDILKLADHLTKVPRRGFHMGVWSRVVDGDSIKPRHVKQGFECGMVACLGGHAAVVFPHRLRLVKTGMFFANLRSEGGYSIKYGSSAFAKAFDLCSNCASELTDTEAPHTTPKRAIRTLQRLVAGKDWETAGVNVRKSRPSDCHFGVDDCSG